MATYSGKIIGNTTVCEGDDCSKLLEVTGAVYVLEGATLTAPALAEVTEIFQEIANCGYVLFASNARYKAGCRGPWSAAKALSHWDRTDVRAVNFTTAIKAHEAAKDEAAE